MIKCKSNVWGFYLLTCSMGKYRLSIVISLFMPHLTPPVICCTDFIHCGQRTVQENERMKHKCMIIGAEGRRGGGLCSDSAILLADGRGWMKGCWFEWRPDVTKHQGMQHHWDDRREGGVVQVWLILSVLPSVCLSVHILSPLPPSVTSLWLSWHMHMRTKCQIE